MRAYFFVDPQCGDEEKGLICASLRERERANLINCAGTRANFEHGKFLQDQTTSLKSNPL